MEVKGLDLSKYQIGIDFNAIKNAGYKFVILRVGVRGYKYSNITKDECFESFYKQAKANGLGVGAYFFTQATNDVEALDEANFVSEAIKGKVFEYPIYIDTEYSNNAHNGRADNISKATRTSVCKTFCDALERRGYYAGIYCSESWLSSKLDYKELRKYDKWIAKWSPIKPYTLYGTYGMWQNSNAVYIGGIRCDGNIRFYDYPAIMKDKCLNGFKNPVKKYRVTVNNITNGDKELIVNVAKSLSLKEVTIEEV